MSYDAIVIGAGISGAATAYHLRKAGAKTLLVERGEPASGGTGKSAAIIRQSYSTPLLVRLARASISMFQNSRAELGKDAGFVLFPARSTGRPGRANHLVAGLDGNATADRDRIRNLAQIGICGIGGELLELKRGLTAGA